MRQHARLIAVALAVIFAFCYTPTTNAQSSSFQVTVPSAKNGIFATEQVGNSNGCTGGNISPEIDWSGAPDGTLSYVLTMYDMDAPTGSGLWHWLVFNIPSSAKSLPAGAGDPSKSLLPAGATIGHNDVGVSAYVGPCPTAGDRPHRYLISLYALKMDKLPLDQNASGALLGFYAGSAMLGKATTTVVYGKPSALTVTSPVVTDGGSFSMEQVGNSNGCAGGNVSPEIDWSGAPDGTQSFAVSMYDMDAPTGSGLWHWVVFNIPASARSLPAGAGDPTKNLLPSGAVIGRNDIGMSAYAGPCPSQGDQPHRYFITVSALKIDKIPLDQNASGALVGFYTGANALARTTITVTYGR